MARLRSCIALVLLLSGCAGQAPPSATPDPAVADTVRSQMGNEVCSDRVAGALTARHLAASDIARVELAPYTPGYPTEYSLALRQVWVRQTNRPGTIIVRYDPRDCRIATVDEQNGAMLPPA